MCSNFVFKVINRKGFQMSKSFGCAKGPNKDSLHLVWESPEPSLKMEK